MFNICFLHIKRNVTLKLELLEMTHQIQEKQNTHLTRKNDFKILNFATKLLPEFYSRCNPEFKWKNDANPRRVLTKPSVPALNNGYDNEDGDYILYVNDIIGTHIQYTILDILGQGTFGQVVKCQNIKTNEIVAVKVIKNKPAYYNQSLVEVSILGLVIIFKNKLNNRFDKNDQFHIVRMKDSFVHQSHLCLTFELLSLNLYELIKQSRFSGFSTNLVRVFTAQILDTLIILRDAKIIHCDLKPENILLKKYTLIYF